MYEIDFSFSGGQILVARDSFGRALARPEWRSRKREHGSTGKVFTRARWVERLEIR